MTRFLTIAAARPAIAWYLGYVPFLVLITGVVTLQSGWRDAWVAVIVNAALMAVPVAAVWAATAVLARIGGPRSWGARRAIGVACAVVVTGAASVPVMETPALAALVGAVNVVPLAIGVGIEAVARRVTGERG